MTVLYPHQSNQLDEVRAALRQHQAVLMQSPTGSGKTQIGTFAARSAVEKGNGVMWMCHRKELLEGTSKTFLNAGIQHSLLVSGQHHNQRLLATIASVGTLSNRLESIRPPKLLIPDECHHSSAASWARIIAWAKANGTKILGCRPRPGDCPAKGSTSISITWCPGHPSPG